MTTPATAIAGVEKIPGQPGIACGHRLISAPVPASFQESLRTKSGVLAGIRRDLRQLPTFMSFKYDGPSTCFFIDVNDRELQPSTKRSVGKTLMAHVFAPSPA